MHVVKTGTAALLAVALLLAGCSGDTGAGGPAGPSGPPGGQGPQGDVGPAGPSGPQGPAGTSATAFGTLSGVVSDYLGNAIPGATVSVTVGTDKLTATTGATGAYALQWPPAPRTVTWAAANFVTFSQTVDVQPAATTTLNVKLNPVGPAAVVAKRTDTAAPVVPGLQVSLSATVIKFDPALASATPTFKWTVVSGPAATFDDATSAAPNATLATAAEFKKSVVELAAPRYKVNPDEPPVNVDRYQPVPISYEQALTFGPATKFKVEATLGGRTYAAFVTVNAAIPAVPTTGLTNVPVNAPVVLQGQFPFKTAAGAYVFTPKATWDWSIAGPAGTTVLLNDPTTPYPDFTPTAAGTYVVSEGGAERLRLFAGTYQGAMSGPATPDAACTGCHNGANAPDNFTPWMGTGHKEVIWAGIMELPPDGHYAATCTPCHTVGNGRTGSGGFADKVKIESPGYGALQGDLEVERDFWALYPQSARLAGVQCENCHGPQAGSGQHMVGAASKDVVASRYSVGSNVCATCHARAPKHGRFPQWQNSGHASFATFTFNSNEATGALANTCACCHSAQGFKAYRAILPTANGNRALTTLPAGLSLVNAQPITCAACHDVHDEGDLSRAEASNLAKVGPTEGSTYMLPSGFAVAGVGKGALCIACHNSRQGYSTSGLIGPFLHEDGDAKFGTLTSYGAPHEAAQGDVLMGRNGYWLGAGMYNNPQTRSKHSYITDTCVTCHMELTTLDLTLSEVGQTRHDFKATPDVCTKCHTAYSADAVQLAFDGRLATLKGAIGNAILRLKTDDAIPAGTSAVLVANRSGQVDVTEGGVTRRWFIGNKSGQDAFLADPGNGGALVQGCTMVDAISADCTGYLAGAPGVTTIIGGGNAALDGSVTAAGVNGVVAKALWNTVLVQDDASRGVHNPSFTFDVIDASLAHLGTFTR